jgi:hypothetical protein
MDDLLNSIGMVSELNEPQFWNSDQSQAIAVVFVTLSGDS